MGISIWSMSISIPGIEAIDPIWPASPESTPSHVDAQMPSAKDAEKAKRAATVAKMRKRGLMVRTIMPPDPGTKSGKSMRYV